MARLFDDASSEYLASTGTPLTVAPLSMACWFKSDTAAVYQVMCNITDTASNAGHWYLGIWGPSASEVAFRLKYHPINGTEALSTASYSLNTWHHACGVEYPGGLSRAAFLDGGSKGTDVKKRAPSGLDALHIGANRHSSTVYPMSGSVFAVGYWNCALSDTAVALLGKRRWCPLKVRPQNLVAYYDLRHGDNTDWLGRYPVVPVNAPVDTASPPIVYPERDDPVWGLVLPRYRPQHFWPVTKIEAARVRRHPATIFQMPAIV